MPVTVNNILVHGSQIIKYVLLSIGQLSKEVQKCKHKEVRKNSESASRKCNGKTTMEDVMHVNLVNLDLYINSLKKNS